MSNNSLSVMMANYNNSQYIGEALGAIIKQSFQPLEVIVIDDGSTDNSIDVIKGMQEKYPKIRLLRNEKNRGVLYTINRCLSEAKGDYVYPASSDDKVLPGFFEKSMNLLAKYPQAGLCFCDWKMIEEGRTFENRAYLSDKPSYFSPEEFTRIMLRNEFTVIGGAAAIAKRSALVKAGGYIPELKASCDLFAYHVISFRYGACYFPGIMAMLRKHENQYSSRKFRPLSVELEMVKSAMDILLTPEYSDVLPKFEKTAPFSHRSWDVLMFVLKNKKYRRFFSLKLLRYALFDRFIRRMLLLLFPLSVWRPILNRYRRLRYGLGRMTGTADSKNGK